MDFDSERNGNAVALRKVLTNICNLAAITQYEDEYYLILAKESTPECNLDLYWSDGNKWFFDGFALFDIQPLLDYFNEQGLEFEDISNQDNINFKRLAARAGIGSPGKNSLIVNFEYGSKLRFKAVKLEERLADISYGIITTAINIFDGCKTCNLCVDRCVNGCLERLTTEFNLFDLKQCEAYLELEKPTEDDGANRCIVCTSLCMDENKR